MGKPPLKSYKQVFSPLFVRVCGGVGGHGSTRPPTIPNMSIAELEDALPDMPVPQSVDSDPKESVGDWTPGLGDRVSFTWTLARRSTRGRDGQWTNAWTHEPWPGASEPESREGIIVGIRTLSNGRVEYGYYDEPTTYYPTETLRAFLIAFDVRRKPVLALPQHVKVLT